MDKTQISSEFRGLESFVSSGYISVPLGAFPTSSLSSQCWNKVRRHNSVCAVIVSFWTCRSCRRSDFILSSKANRLACVSADVNSSQNLTPRTYYPATDPVRHRLCGACLSRWLIRSFEHPMLLLLCSAVAHGCLRGCALGCCLRLELGFFPVPRGS